eukprot:CAMPEP_0172308074 /NCGR_PEP_ID=MMETSP1058-20130122/8785_1 /TAXON_ID=83371 /ORGANISM="Detonula confervacea, Strain CCMP 353" /LENGTH=942 /DNA_ID=CAMNT_0013020423 /DNA_START=44 /DNA_END=2872 /DNA_ORIENTATION=-
MSARSVHILLVLLGASPITAKQPSINKIGIGFVPNPAHFLNKAKSVAKFHSGISRIELGNQSPYSSKVPSQLSGQGVQLILHNSKREHEENGASKEFEPHYLLEMIEDTTTTKTVATVQRASEETMQQSCIQRRQFIIASTVLASQLSLAFPSDALDTKKLPILNAKNNYQQSPINKRSGFTLSEPERIYPLSFITYLSRFLLVFDDECQQWWYTQAQGIPAKSNKEDVERIRLGQFGQFAASVEVGLTDFEGKDGEGVKKLIDSLAKRYGPSSLKSSGDETDDATEREIRKSKEALRQIALLFSLLEDYQPVDSITVLLAADDDAKIDKIDIVDGGAGYPPPAYTTPDVTFPEPPTLGTDFGGSVAKGTAVMKETGRILKVELTQGGRGYLDAPSVEIRYRGDNDVSEGERIRASSQAFLGKKKLKGCVERIEIVDPGMGYDSLGDITVTISPPEGKDGVTATAKAILEYEVSGIDIVDEGSGYAAEKVINIVIDPPPGAAGGSGGSRSAFAVSYPKGKLTSYESFIGSGRDGRVSASRSSVDTSQWIAGPTSSQLLALLPSGFGLQYDDTLERYILSRSSSSNNWDDILGGSLEGQKFKPINPIFGLRGRSPIEKEKSLDISKVARYMASGAISSSIAHFALTPIDVVKTKVQTKPDVYNAGIIGTFTKVLEEEGAGTFFNGWEPTFVGFFCAGGFGFFLTEYFRRFFTSLAMSTMMAQSSMSEVSAASVISSLEIPLIVAGAALAAFFCCFILAPFDAVRIRTVSQPDYADNIFGVVARMVQEEGLLSLFSALPVWWLKEIPFNVFKFLVFDTSTEYMYEAFPAAREDIRLSLLVSLLGGTLGGIAATIVSNPADVVVSELKKSKTEMSPWEAVERLKERAGLPAFASGMSLRAIFYSLLVSVQFLLYDSVRIALGVGTDDMKLYLNVLNVALNEKVKQ